MIRQLISCMLQSVEIVSMCGILPKIFISGFVDEFLGTADYILVAVQHYCIFCHVYRKLRLFRHELRVLSRFSIATRNSTLICDLASIFQEDYFVFSFNFDGYLDQSLGFSFCRFRSIFSSFLKF